MYTKEPVTWRIVTNRQVPYLPNTYIVWLIHNKIQLKSARLWLELHYCDFFLKRIPVFCGLVNLKKLRIIRVPKQKDIINQRYTSGSQNSTKSMTEWYFIKWLPCIKDDACSKANLILDNRPTFPSFKISTIRTVGTDGPIEIQRLLYTSIKISTNKQCIYAFATV